MTQEMPPDSRRPLDTYYDEDMGRLQTYSMEVKISGGFYISQNFRENFENFHSTP